MSFFVVKSQSKFFAVYNLEDLPPADNEINATGGEIIVRRKDY